MTETAVRLEQMEPIAVAVIRRQVGRAELPRVVPELCGEVWATLRRRQLQGGRNVAIYRDASILLEAGVECDATFSDDPAVQFTHFPVGRTIIATHLGPYSTLARAHEVALSWARGQGLRLAGPSWERYGHWQPDWNDHPERILTEIGYLIE